MGYYMTVKRLREELAKYDDAAIVMVGDRETGDVIDADDQVSYMYRTEDGEVVDQFDHSYDETLLGKQRAVILWSVDR